MASTHLSGNSNEIYKNNTKNINVNVASTNDKGNYCNDGLNSLKRVNLVSLNTCRKYRPCSKHVRKQQNSSFNISSNAHYLETYHDLRVAKILL